MKQIILASLIFIPFYTNAQSESIRFGFKIEFYAYTLYDIENEYYDKSFNLSPLPSMYFIIAKDLSKSTSISLKPGLLLRPEVFQGFELGLLLKYKFTDAKAFLNGGVNMHIPKETAHGVIYYKATDSAPIFFILFGIGYRLSEIVHIDITYHHALNPEFGFVSNWISQFSSSSGPLKIANMIKLGLSFGP
jgi:hypothetical protein